LTAALAVLQFAEVEAQAIGGWARDGGAGHVQLRPRDLVFAAQLRWALGRLHGSAVHPKNGPVVRLYLDGMRVTSDIPKPPNLLKHLSRLTRASFPVQSLLRSRCIWCYSETTGFDEQFTHACTLDTSLSFGRNARAPHVREVHLSRCAGTRVVAEPAVARTLTAKVIRHQMLRLKSVTSFPRRAGDEKAVPSTGLGSPVGFHVRSGSQRRVLRCDQLPRL
jgi:hypothetical protein